MVSQKSIHIIGFWEYSVISIKGQILDEKVDVYSTHPQGSKLTGA